MSKPCLTFFAISWGIVLGQSGPPVAAYGNTLPTPVLVAPGQLVTLYLVNTDPALTQIVRAQASANLPTSLGDVSVFYDQIYAGTSPGIVNGNAPILNIYPFYTRADPVLEAESLKLAAVTVQIPFEAQSPGGGTISAGGVGIDAAVFSDQVHIITTCDAFMVIGEYVTDTGLPCPQLITHADGSTVSVNAPAKAGEELVAYAVGLGQTNPASVTGQLVTTSAPTQITYTLDYNFHPNALSSRPLPTGPRPIFAGTTPGYVGLYQVNFVVPPVPAGTPPCVDASALPLGSNVVQSNLTVSIGGQYSFDGARICVATN